MKKLLSLMIMAIMLISMATAVTVSAATSEIVVFDSSTDIARVSDLGGSTFTETMDENKIITSTATKDITSNTVMFQRIAVLNYLKGGTYKVSFSAKGGAGIGKAMFRFSTNINGSTSYSDFKFDLTSDWADYNFEISISSFADNSSIKNTNFLLYSNDGSSTTIANGSSLQIKDFKVTQAGVPRVTIYDEANGTATLTGDGVVEASDGNGYFVAPGTDATLSVDAIEGYKAVVKRNGNDVAVTNDTAAITNVTDDTVLTVSYEPTNAEVIVLDATFDNVTRPNSNYDVSLDSEKVAIYCKNKSGSDITSGDIFRIASVDWIKGGTYNVSFDVTVTKAVKFKARLNPNKEFNDSAYLDLTADLSSAGATTIDTTFTIDTIKDNAMVKNGSIYLYASNIPADAEIWISNFKVTQTGVPRIALTNGDNGTADLAGDGVVKASDGNGYFVAPGTTATLTVAANDGYEAVVTKNDTLLVVPNNGVITLDNVTDDTALVVSYVKKAEVALGFEDTTVWFKPVADVDTIYVYSKISEYTTGESGLNYGVVINNENWNAPVILKSLTAGSTKDNQVADIAAPGKAFAIKVFGGAISNANGIYTVAPFVGELTAEQVTLDYTAE